MKKRVVITLVLLLFLLGVEGCMPPSLQRFEGKQEQLIRLRGLSIEFIRNKPKLQLEDGNIVMEAGKDFYISLNISNYMTNPVSGEIYVQDTSDDSSLIGKESSDFFADGFISEGDYIEAGNDLVEFGPYEYDIEKIGDGKGPVNLITEINFKYETLFNFDLCFDRENRKCSNYATLSESMLKGDAGISIISINKIEKEIDIDDNIIELTINLKNFGEGTVKKIQYFNINVLSGSISLVCDDDAIFKDDKAEIYCSGTIDSGVISETAPVEITFSYEDYNIIKTISYDVIPSKRGQNI